MIRLLIVDDEKTIREGLTYTIDWNKYGFIVVGTARNGLEALEFFHNNYADIVISDIKMPKMDGLSLQKELSKKYPNLPFVFISGYEDFTYVSSALRQGASSYILKPVNPDELLSELKRICDSSSLTCENTPLRNLILRNLSNFGMEWDYTNYEFLKREIHDHYFSVINIRCNYQDMKSHIFFLTFKQKIQSIVESTFADYDLAFIEASPRGIVYCVNDSDEYSLKQKFSKLSTNLSTQLGQYSFSGFGIWSGGIYKGIEKVIESYAESFSDSGLILTHVPNESDYTNVYTMLFDKEDEIITLLLNRNISDAKALLARNTSNNINLSPDDALFYFKHLIYRYTLALNQTDNSLDINPDYLDSNNLKGLTISDMCDKTISKIDELYRTSKPFVFGQSENYMGKVKSFIEDNYEDPYLTLTEIAAYIPLNPSYLCTEFTKQMGIGVIQYLTKVRLKHAKELLLNTNKKINDISLQVGYLNSNYFSTLFRKQEKITPSEFRKEHLLNN